MHLRRLANLVVPLSLFASCNDGGRVELEDSTATDPTGSPTTNDGTDDTTTGDPTTTGESVDDGSSGTTGGEGTCETFQCGGTCCAEGEECVLGECRDACASGIRCGQGLEVCCGDGEVCLQPECVVPGIPCLDSYDCPEGEFCELTVNPAEDEGACLPQQDPVLCEVLPDFEDVTVTLEWYWDEQQIVTIPIVADIDGDNLPEVIVNTTHYDENGDGNENGAGEGNITGIIVVFDGTTGQEQFRIVNDPPGCAPAAACNTWGSYGRTTLGVADVDGNGLPDIIYAGRPMANPLNRSLLHAVNGVGQHLWRTHTLAGADHSIYIRAGAPAFANFDDDPESEIVVGAAIIDNDGRVVWDQDGDGGLYGSPAGYRGPISAVADLTGDGYPEIISGRHAWSVDWSTNILGPSVTLTQLWDAGGPDGFPAVADLDQNGTPEVILVAGGQVRVLDGATGRLWCGVDPTGVLCENNDAARTQPLSFPNLGVPEDRGGPPTVADFDGDGRPEFAAAGAGAYVVLDLYRDEEEIVQPQGFPPPAPGDIFVKWFAETQDETSRSTGSSVFDFQGDGVAEVLYGDECYVRIYNGQTGDVIAQIESSSATIHEYPIVVDSDADGNSEILVVSNDVGAEERCGSLYPGYQPRRGIYVYGDAFDQWVRTRRVWNTHTYHVTNSDSRGLTPEQEVDNWTEPGLNNYRQNAQGEGIFNAPDLSVDLTVGFSKCLQSEFEIRATVRNEGSQGVPPGVEVALYEGVDATGTLVGVQYTQEALLPGAFEVVTWEVPAPGGLPTRFFVTVDGVEAVTECVEANNSASTEPVACPIEG